VQPGTIDLVVEENGIAKSVASFNLTQEITGNNSLRLKLEKTGNTYTGYYAINDGEFVKLGVANGLLKDIKAGIIACDGVIIQSMKNTFWFDPSTTKPNTPFDGTFDYFRITNK
jgi:beta-glucosidase